MCVRAWVYLRLEAGYEPHISPKASHLLPACAGTWEKIIV